MESRYKEKPELYTNLIDMTFVGESGENTILAYNDYVNKTNKHGNEFGAFGRGTSSSTGWTSPQRTFDEKEVAKNTIEGL